MLSRRSLTWLALGLGLLALLAVIAWALPRRAEAPANVVHVSRGPINSSIEALGRVRPDRQAQLSLRGGGRVADVKVQIGDKVEAGQALLTLDAAQAERDVRQAELELAARRQKLDQARAGGSPADIEAAQAAVREATVAREVAQAQYDDRAKQPDARTSEEAARLEAAKAAYQRARASLDKALSGSPPEAIAALQTGVAQAELALTTARARLDETRLTAPFAGVVLDVLTRPGENVGAGAPLVLLADVTKQHIEADVEEVDAPLVQAGQSAEVRLDAFPGQTLAATVTRIAPAATTRQGATSYTTWLELPPTDLALKPGMGATVTIATRTKPDALLVPARAVQSVGRQKIVRVLRNGRPIEAEVTTGLSDKQQVEILDGLREGDLVIVE